MIKKIAILIFALSLIASTVWAISLIGSGVPSGCAAGNEDLAPDDTSSTGWNASTGCTATEHQDCIDEAYASTDGDTTMVQHDYGGDGTDEYTIANTSSMPGACSTTKIEVLISGKDTSGSEADLIPRIFINAGWVNDDTPASQTLTGSYVWYTWTFTGVWTKTNVDGMSIDVKCINNAESQEAKMSTVVVRVYWGS